MCETEQGNVGLRLGTMRGIYSEHVARCVASQKTPSSGSVTPSAKQRFIHPLSYREKKYFFFPQAVLFAPTLRGVKIRLVLLLFYLSLSLFMITQRLFYLPGSIESNPCEHSFKTARFVIPGAFKG